MTRQCDGRSRYRPRAPVLALVLAVLCISTAVAGPRLVLLPNPVKAGESVVVHGHEFCVAPECSAIAVQLEDETVVEATPVNKNGTFSTSFEAATPPGCRKIVAIQRNTETGEIIQTHAFVILGVGEQEPGRAQEVPQ